MDKNVTRSCRDRVLVAAANAQVSPVSRQMLTSQQRQSCPKRQHPVGKLTTFMATTHRLGMAL
jgi:hypothetical protein